MTIRDVKASVWESAPAYQLLACLGVELTAFPSN